MKKIFIIAYALFVLFFFYSACSTSEDGEKEKGAIENMTDQVAEDIVKKIQTPIDKARTAKDIEESRAEKIDEIVDEVNTEH